MLEILMTKAGSALIPYDAVGMDEFDLIHDGAQVKVKITQPRNLAHYRMWSALLKATFDALDYFRTLDEPHDAIKLAIGHSEERRTISGETYFMPRSIAFSKMDNLAFRAFFDRAVESCSCGTGGATELVLRVVDPAANL